MAGASGLVAFLLLSSMIVSAGRVTFTCSTGLFDASFMMMMEFQEYFCLVCMIYSLNVVIYFYLDRETSAMFTFEALYRCNLIC